MAMKDGLTGLYNHKLIIDLLKKECKKAETYKEHISFIMIDIDFFKNVNDTYGHSAGDDVLRDLSKLLQSNSREGDIIGRYGGEEFCIIIPNTTQDETYMICERVRKAVEEHIFITDEADVRITISVGSCMRNPESTSCCKAMILEADKALYRAKNSGRNKTETYILA